MPCGPIGSDGRNRRPGHCLDKTIYGWSVCRPASGPCAEYRPWRRRELAEEAGLGVPPGGRRVVATAGPGPRPERVPGRRALYSWPRRRLHLRLTVGESVQSAQAVRPAAPLVLAARAAPAGCGPCGWPRRHGGLGAHVRVAGQIVRCWIVDALFSEKGFEAVDITGCLVDPVACARDECAVSFDPSPVLVPGRSDIDRQVWPAGKKSVVLGLRPEDGQHRCGVVVCAVRSEGSPCCVVHRYHAHDRRERAWTTARRRGAVHVHTEDPHHVDFSHARSVSAWCRAVDARVNSSSVLVSSKVYGRPCRWVW